LEWLFQQLTHALQDPIVKEVIFIQLHVP
jgi:hypothetical protein